MAENQTPISALQRSSMVDSPAPDPFPTEILDNILGFIAPELPEYTDVEVTPQQAIEPPETYMSAQSALFSMCLASSRLYALARPLLFRTIVIWKADSLILLWRTLTRQPSLGSLIHHIACWITLSRHAVIRRTIEAVEEKLGLGTSPRNQRLDDLVVNALNYVPQQIIFDMLCRTTHLMTLSLQVPRTAEQIGYTYLMQMIADSRHWNGTSSPPITLSHNHLPRLRPSPATLQLCVDPCVPEARRSEAVEDADMGFDHRDYWPLFGIPGLVRLHCRGNDGTRGLRDLPEGYFEGIREIRLDASSAGPQSLYAICQSAPQLETLRVSQRRHAQQPAVRHQPPDPKNLNSGLRMRAATLRHLHLNFYASLDYRCYDRPDLKLICLPELCRLETLQIQLQTLFGRRSAIPRFSHFGNLLPSSLVELTLDDEWDQAILETVELIQLYSGLIEPEEFQGGWVVTPDTEAIFWHVYRSAILKMLMLLYEFSAEQLPHLRRVHYVSNDWCQRWERDDAPEKPFEEVQVKFSERGIEFYAGEKMLMHA